MLLSFALLCLNNLTRMHSMLIRRRDTDGPRARTNPVLIRRRNADAFSIPVHPSLILLSFLLLLVLLFSISALFPQASMQSKSYSRHGTPRFFALSENPMSTVLVLPRSTLYASLFPAFFGAFPFDCLGVIAFPLSLPVTSF